MDAVDPRASDHRVVSATRVNRVVAPDFLVDRPQHARPAEHTVGLILGERRDAVVVIVLRHRIGQRVVEGRYLVPGPVDRHRVHVVGDDRAVLNVALRRDGLYAQADQSAVGGLERRVRVAQRRRRSAGHRRIHRIERHGVAEPSDDLIHERVGHVIVVGVGGHGLDVVHPPAIAEQDVVAASAGDVIVAVPAERDERQRRSAGVYAIVSRAQVQ